MNSDNAVQLAKIDRDLDALIALTKNDGIDNDELVERLSSSVIELKDIYDRGGIDSKYMYDLAIDVSDKIESVDPGECFWTLNFEYKSGGQLFPLNMVIDDAKDLKSVADYNLSQKKSIRPTKLLEISDDKPSAHFTNCLKGMDIALYVENEKPTDNSGNRNLVLWNKGCAFAEDNLTYNYLKKSYVSESSGRVLSEILKERPHLKVLDQSSFVSWHELNAEKYETNELTQELKEKMTKEIIDMCQYVGDNIPNIVPSNNSTQRMK